MTSGITYLDGPRLARSLFAAADWVAAGRDEEINRINVFPVPDGDTGTNFSLTLRAVADALRALGDAPLPETARAMSRAAVLGARGNSGMMLAHFLLGFADALGEGPTATTSDVARAMRLGADRLYESLDDPREGTILTVAREAAAAADRAAGHTGDLGEFMRLLDEGEVALARTPELMAVLREAGVVDAGGKGFVRMIEGVVRYIEGDPILPIIATNGTSPASPSAPAALVEVAAERDFRFCTEVLVRGEQLPTSNEARASLHAFGGSLVVAVAGDILKIHVHTDTPEAVFSYASRWGRVETTKADDMRAQHRRLAHPGRRAVAVVTDSSADLSDSVLDRHRISLVPLQVVFGDDDVPRPRGAQAGGVLPPAAGCARPPDHLAARPRRVRPGVPGREGGGRGDRRRAAVGRAIGHLRLGPGGSSRWPASPGVHLVDSRSASLGWGCWPCGRPSWPRRGGTEHASRRSWSRVRSRIGHAADRGPVRQPAPVGPGLPRQGVDRGDARREADPVAG